MTLRTSAGCTCHRKHANDHPHYEGGLPVMLGDLVRFKDGLETREAAVDEIRWNHHVGAAWLSAADYVGLVLTVERVDFVRRAQ